MAVAVMPQGDRCGVDFTLTRSDIARCPVTATKGRQEHYSITRVWWRIPTMLLDLNHRSVTLLALFYRRHTERLHGDPRDLDQMLDRKYREHRR